MRGAAESVRDELYAELTYHAAYDPQRAVRTRRHKLVRHFGERLEPVLPNIDDGPTKELLVASGWALQPRPRVELYDLLGDPGEMRNLADDPAHSDVRAHLEARLDGWMRDTDDPLLEGPVPVPPGAWVNSPEGLSATEPAVDAVD